MLNLLKLKSVATVGAVSLAALATSTAQAAVCGVYNLEAVASCDAFKLPAGTVGGPVVVTVTGQGNKTLSAYAGFTFTEVVPNSPVPQNATSIIADGLLAGSTYITLIFDTPANVDVWAVFSATGAAFSTANGGVSIAAEGTSTGNYKLGGIYLRSPVNQVPVPGSLALLGLGVVALGAASRKKA